MPKITITHRPQMSADEVAGLFHAGAQALESLKVESQGSTRYITDAQGTNISIQSIRESVQKLLTQELDPTKARTIAGVCQQLSMKLHESRSKTAVICAKLLPAKLLPQPEAQRLSDLATKLTLKFSSPPIKQDNKALLKEWDLFKSFAKDKDTIDAELMRCKRYETEPNYSELETALKAAKETALAKLGEQNEASIYQFMQPFANNETMMKAAVAKFPAVLRDADPSISFYKDLFVEAFKIDLKDKETFPEGMPSLVGLVSYVLTHGKTLEFFNLAFSPLLASDPKVAKVIVEHHFWAIEHIPEKLRGTDLLEASVTSDQPLSQAPLVQNETGTWTKSEKLMPAYKAIKFYNTGTALTHKTIQAYPEIVKEAGGKYIIDDYRLALNTVFADTAQAKLLQKQQPRLVGELTKLLIDASISKGNFKHMSTTDPMICAYLMEHLEYLKDPRIITWLNNSVPKGFYDLQTLFEQLYGAARNLYKGGSPQANLLLHSPVATEHIIDAMNNSSWYYGPPRTASLKSQLRANPKLLAIHKDWLDKK